VNDPLLQSSIQSLEEILKLHDEAFVKAAYVAILGRAPDPGGLENYLSQVRAGANKAQILGELARSPEGVAAMRGPHGMQHIRKKYGKHPPIWRRLIRRVSGQRRESIDRQLRILDNRLYLVEQAIVNQTGIFAELLSSLHRSEQSESRSTGPKSSHSFDSGEAGCARSSSQLSQGLARTYIELKTAIEKKLKEP
jgi:hypothetical protein